MTIGILAAAFVALVLFVVGLVGWVMRAFVDCDVCCHVDRDSGADR